MYRRRMLLVPEPKNIGDPYLVTEWVECKEMAQRTMYLVGVEPTNSSTPRLVLSEISYTDKNCVPIYLMVSSLEGDAWRRVFLLPDGKWHVYWPIGGRTWNLSWVDLEVPG